MRHRINSYSGRVDLFFAEDRPVSVSAPAHRDWSRFLTGAVQETILPGDHYSLLRKENVQQLAHCVMNLLAEPPVKTDSSQADAAHVAKNLAEAGANR
jgi:thioesterase domain-containing protein